MDNGIGAEMIKCGRVYVSKEASLAVPQSVSSGDKAAGNFKSILKSSGRKKDGTGESVAGDNGADGSGAENGGTWDDAIGAARLANQGIDISKGAIQNRGDKAPYSYLADASGQIVYKNAVFNVDNEHKTISLGDISDMDKVLRIALSGGGCLLVNRENIGQLAGAIGMFSPEDVNQILRAIRMDAKIQEIKRELEDIKDGKTQSAEASLQESDREAEELLAKAEQSELAERIRNGKKETSFATGGSAFTQSQWNSLLDTVDEAFDQIRKEAEERTEEIKEAVKEDKDSQKG